MMFKISKDIPLTGYTLVIPTVSVGNVAQLAVDLLIETLKLNKIGLLWHPALIPVVGPPAFDHDVDKITTTAELFASEHRKLLVLQIRAPLVGALQSDFLDELTVFVQDRQLAEIIVLSSSFAHENHQIGARPYKYLANEPFLSGNAETLQALQWAVLEGNVIHGGGYATKLLDACSEKQLACFILFNYVSEGDNRADAVQLVSLLDKLKTPLFPRESDGVQIKLAIPSSWKHLFGNSAPVNVY
ncbi:proteasome assembly chaperone 2 [Topomyia yanbarensis]|uniref:proteasome assembly chaperone 2 n=1 Tax=Topomyia yanbarensis TaxID=2498891 RepID=UPI00273B2186|nr:proteasome assembly chaperone 2 [Topomyia yanbarensis]XP_058823672.1 proteasome assembly chaperone 2 [Topomyia yanbarensis]XP_058823673.1 proteasome assembly chaperone 2 [Topomyia yanbarensis]